jgi:ketosteroid isomerase-like protein
MAGSRAASAREPGQIREEAALSDTARAPRTSLAGADDRRARPRVGLEDGCTVHTPFMPEEENLALARRVVERWNAGDLDGYVELHHDDVVMVTTPEWPEQGPWKGREQLRARAEEWRGAWERIAVSLEDTRAKGDTVVIRGSWRTRGRASGAAPSLDFSLVLTSRDGKIERAEFFREHEDALRAAGLAP